ncbi:MAG: AraC family transcriptional regulator [Planctomycetes bacterium]|nr:AraC family transcriptional regulator [Planctomycetota bacterium]
MGSAPGVLRLKIDKASCLSPCLCQVGWAVFPEPVHDVENLPAHVHERAYEICYIAHGTVDWWVGERLFEVGPGCVFITFPGERHGGLHDIMNPCELFWVQLEFPAEGNLPGLSRDESASLVDQFNRIEHRCFPATAQTPVLFKRLIDEHRGVSEHSVILVRAALIDLLVAVVRGQDLYRRRNMVGLQYSKPIRQALELIDRRLEECFKMDEIAEAVGLSTTSFYRHFSQEVHVTPGEYLTQQRMHRAKALLRDPALSVTAIAHALGYSSSQYFATTFRRVTGVTPRMYRTTALREAFES